jgi:tRNA guanosine-2'-O-methyltransferase
MEDYNLRLITKLTALSAAPKVPIRHEAQWCFPILFADAKAKKYTSITSNPALVELDKFIRTLDKFNKPPNGKIFGSFDASKDMNLATLFEGDYLKIDPPEAPLVRVEDFEEVVARDSNTHNIEVPPAHLPLGRSTRTFEPTSIDDQQQSSAEPQSPTSAAPRSTPLQTKSFNIDASITSPLDASATLTTHPTPTGPILIASLLTNAHNLGGLSRVAEIFGCASLHIPDANVLRNHQFKNVSVNSEEHVKIEETGPGDLVAWLRDMKASGGQWTVVGVEQTDTSKVIGMPTGQAALDLGIAPSAWDSAGGPESGGRVLPKKSIIIMGAEKTGIPADVLVECDVCVEIKQWGVTRSLNVQTAAACVLFDWRREWGRG